MFGIIVSAVLLLIRRLRKAKRKRKMKTIEILKRRLDSVLREVSFLQAKIKEEERRTEKFVVRVVVETRARRESEWMRTPIVQLGLTIEERDRMVKKLSWLRFSEGKGKA